MYISIISYSPNAFRDPEYIRICLPDVGSCSHDLCVYFHWFQLLISFVNAFQQLLRTSVRLNITNLCNHLTFITHMLKIAM